MPQILIYEEVNEKGEKLDSIINRLGPNTRLREKMKEVPEAWRGVDENEIFEAVKPNETLQILRHSFWTEAHLAFKSNRFLNLENVHKHVCGKNHFKKLLDHIPNVAYILTPIINYETKLEVQHYKAFNEVNKILNQASKTPSGKYDYNIARLKLEIFKYLDERRFGGSVQRTLNINKNINDEEPLKKENGKSKAELVKELEAELRGKTVEDIVDAEVIESAE